MANASVVKKPGTDSFFLPYGYVQSPILASMALDKSKLGSLLRSLAKRRDLRVSVYVDDIVISGDHWHDLNEAANLLHAVASAALFPINPAKAEGPAVDITAFNINVSHGVLRISDSRLAEFRSAYQEAMSDHCRAGIVNYVSSVNPAQAHQLIC